MAERNRDTSRRPFSSDESRGTAHEDRSRRGPGLLFWGLAGIGALAFARARARRRRELILQDRVVLITGGSRGLGLVLAREFARQGARIAICARDEAELERAREELTRLGAQVLAVPADLTDQAQVIQMVRTVTRQLGPVEVLVNNAGIISVGPLETMTLEDYQAAMDIHFWASLYTCLQVLPEMRQRRQGRIVNISSIGGRVPVPHLLPYCASKFALAGLSEGLRAELTRDQVYVTTVFPGLMRTGSPRNALFKGHKRTEYALFSVTDTLPFTTVSAEHAARRIVRACRRGDAQLVISPQARLAELAHTLFPGLTADLLSVVGRLLPAGEADTSATRGAEIDTSRRVIWLTRRSREAARRNNEIA